MTVFDEIIEAIPFWANAHLSMDLVDDPLVVFADEAELERVNRLIEEKTLEYKSTMAVAAAEEEGEQLSIAKRKLRQLRIKMCKLEYDRAQVGKNRAAAHMFWFPYESVISSLC